MRIINEYPHFKGAHLSRAENIERFVVEQLVNSKVLATHRESSVAWELMHSSSCKAFMHVIAEKRGMADKVGLIRIAGALHDFHVIKTGKYKNHAQKGAIKVKDILIQTGQFKAWEIDFIVEMVEHHSDKHIHSPHDHIELIKDVDVFDCSLYSGTEIYYLTKKPLPICKEYFRRIIKVRTELGMPLPDSYFSLEAMKNGPLRNFSQAISLQDQRIAFSVKLAALGGLSQVSEANSWTVFFDGKKTEWWTNSKRLPKAKSLDWKDVVATFAQVAYQINEQKHAFNRGSIRKYILQLQALFAETFACIKSMPALEEKAAIAMRDFNCDSDADQKMTKIIYKALLHKPGLVSAMRTLDDSFKSFSDRKSPFQEFLSLPTDEKPAWELDKNQSKLTDKLARYRSLQMLRDGIAQWASAYMEKYYPQWIDQYPFSEFGSEEVETTQDKSSPWLAIAWPQFGNFEFLIDTKAEVRFAELNNYWKNEWNLLV